MTQHYLLPCSCGQNVRIAASQAGGKVACVCGKSLEVPTMRGVQQLEAAPAESKVAAKPAWSPLHGATFAAGLMIAGVGVVLIAFYLLQYARVVGHTRDFSPEVLAAEAAHIDKLTPLELLGEWSEVLEHGLGDPSAPPWVTAKIMIAGYRARIIGGATAVAAGLMLSVATLFVGRRRV
jgi:hypothetical protein